MIGWRRAELRREAFRNVGDPRSRHALVVAVALILGFGLAFLLAGEWRALHDDLDALAAAGRGVVILESDDPGVPAHIDVASCRSLTDLPDVVRAGSFRTVGARSFVQLGPLVPVVEADPALVPGLHRAAAVIGDELGSFGAAISLRAPDGWSLGAVEGSREPSGLAGLNSSVAVALPVGAETTDRCAVVLGEFADPVNAVPRLLTGLVSDTDLVATLGSSGGYDVVGAYRDRVERFLPVVAGLLGAAFGLVVIRTRGSELAAYRLSGTSRPDLVRLLLLEQLLGAGALVFAGSAGLLANVVLRPAPALDDPVWVAVAGCAWLVVAGPGALLASRGSPADLARDR